MSNVVEREHARARDRARYQRCKEQGLCVTCGKPRGENGSETKCAVHADAASTGRRQRYRHMVGQGLCSVCGKPRGADGTETMCAVHARTMRSGAKVRQAQRIAQGLCVDCGRPCDNGTVRCNTHAEEQRARDKKLRDRLFKQETCPWHKTEMRTLPLCPACLYKAEGRILSFQGLLLPPPAAGDCLEACVGCADCGRVHHKGSSYSAPRRPGDVELNDEHVGEDDAGVLLLYSLGEDEQGKVLALYERCSTPDAPCVMAIKKSTADWYLYLRRADRENEVSGICRFHSRHPVSLSKISEARIGRQPTLSSNGNERQKEGGNGKAGRPPAFTDTEAWQAIDALGSRLSVSQLSKALSCSRPTVDNWVERNGYSSLSELVERRRTAG